RLIQMTFGDIQIFKYTVFLFIVCFFILNCTFSERQLYTDEYETVISDGFIRVSKRKMIQKADILKSVSYDFPEKESVIPDKEFFSYAVQGLKKEMVSIESLSLQIENLTLEANSEKSIRKYFFPYYSDSVRFKTVIVSKLSLRKDSLCFQGESSVFESSERQLNLKVYSFLPVPAWMELLRYASGSVYGIFLIFVPVPYHYYNNGREAGEYSELTAGEYKTHILEAVRNAKEKNLFRKCE
ncbi:MAG TPA: hypothetical protein PK683_16615, partial [Leptospiraceae bacterium]|nr:hypothetical protein [Leptospiraceae bacterium]